MTELLDTHVFCVDPKNNGGESVLIITKFVKNQNAPKEEGFFLNQEIQLNSYCNSASINLYGTPLTPESLRKLANELDKKMASLV